MALPLACTGVLALGFSVRAAYLLLNLIYRALRDYLAAVLEACRALPNISGGRWRFCASFSRSWALPGFGSSLGVSGLRLRAAVYGCSRLDSTGNRLYGLRSD